MARPNKIDELPTFLEVSVLHPCMVTACQITGIGVSTITRYLVRSRMGDAELQAVEFKGVVAPFHTHYDTNVPALTARLIEQNAMDRALNGHYQETRYQGAPVMQRVRNAEYADFTDDDLDRFGLVDEAYEMQPVTEWVAPPMQLTQTMLQAWNRRYKPSQEVKVVHGGVLRLDAPPKDGSDAKQVFDVDAEQVEQRGSYLALAAPALDTADFDKMTERGDFKPQPVVFTNDKGERTELIAKPVVVEQPKPVKQPTTLPNRAGGPGSERIGNAPIKPLRGYRVA